MIHLIEKKEQIVPFVPLFKKECIQGLSIDPGLNTGLCFWSGTEITETKTLTGSGKGFSRQIDIMQKLRHTIMPVTIEYLIIEGVEVWDGLKSQTSAKRGDLTELAILVGMIVNKIYESRRPEIFIVNPSVWKAQLTYKALGVWVNKITGHEFKTEHELAAVGIGLFCQGRLH